MLLPALIHVGDAHGVGPGQACPGGLSVSGPLLGASLGLDSVQVNLGAALWGSALAVEAS